jgi:hypothetical protein
MTAYTSDPSLPLRPYPSLPQSTASTIEELFAGLEHPELNTQQRMSDAQRVDLGTWVLERIAHGHYRRDVRADHYGPFITEALTVLSGADTEPTVTLTVSPTALLRDLVNDHETCLETMLNQLFTVAAHVGLHIEISVTTPDTTNLIHYPPHPKQEVHDA